MRVFLPEEILIGYLEIVSDGLSWYIAVLIFNDKMWYSEEHYFSFFLENLIIFGQQKYVKNMIYANWEQSICQIL
jgi:hypothetical protein